MAGERAKTIRSPRIRGPVSRDESRPGNGRSVDAGHRAKFEVERTANHIYVTATLNAAGWGAELAAGDGPGRIYVVEPTGILDDDPNVTDKKFPGNPTRTYSTREPVELVGELVD
jgi:rifampin ADP-ribosylating transferase